MKHTKTRLPPSRPKKIYNEEGIIQNPYPFCVDCGEDVAWMGDFFCGPCDEKRGEQYAKEPMFRD